MSKGKDQVIDSARFPVVPVPGDDREYRGTLDLDAPERVGKRFRDGAWQRKSTLTNAEGKSIIVIGIGRTKWGMNRNLNHVLDEIIPAYYSSEDTNGKN